MEGFLEISAILALATFVAIIMQKMRLPLVLGHILTGIAVGPFALNLLYSQSTVEIFSQLGIAALLFVVGLSLNPRVIKEVGRVAIISGLGQIIFTTGFGWLLGKALGYNDLTSLYLAAGFAFSSTIIITKLLADRGDLDRLYGKISIGFLLVQDLVATVVLIALTSFGGGDLGYNAWLGMIAKTAIVICILYLMSTWILPRFTRMFAESQEFLFLFAIGWGLGMAAIFKLIGLSVELGALAAGIALASSPYHYEISAKMKMVRDFFIVMFFILLGAKLDLSNLQNLAMPGLIYTAFILIGNPIIVMSILGVMGYTKKTSFYAGLTVAQISEFSFILILIGLQLGQVPNSAVSLATLVGLVTITASSIMITGADKLYGWFSPILGIFERKKLVAERARGKAYEAYLFGCHRVGYDFLGSLKSLGLKFSVVDFDPAVVEKLQKEKVPIRYGDAHDNDFLDEMNFEKAKIIISTLPDEEANDLIVSKAKKLRPDAVIIATARTLESATRLYELGATYVILPHYLGGNYAAMLVEKIGHDVKKYAVERKKHLEHLGARI